MKLHNNDTHQKKTFWLVLEVPVISPLFSRNLSKTCNPSNPVT